jgi:hypothetical protein
MTVWPDSGVANRAPRRMIAHEAQMAEPLSMTTRELVRGTPRNPQGKWEATIGEQGITKIAACTETREEGDALARMAPCHTWWSKYQRILAACHGYLGWGKPIYARE